MNEERGRQKRFNEIIRRIQEGIAAVEGELDALARFRTQHPPGTFRKEEAEKLGTVLGTFASLIGRIGVTLGAAWPYNPDPAIKDARHNEIHSNTQLRNQQNQESDLASAVRRLPD